MNPAQAVTEHLLLAPASQTNSATRTANLDCRGAAYATIRVTMASEINTNAIGPAIVLRESDDTQATNFATFHADCSRTAEDITAAKQVTFKIDTRARKRYLRLSLTTETTTNDNVTASATATLGRKAIEPASEADQAGDTNNVVVQLGL